MLGLGLSRGAVPRGVTACAALAAWLIASCGPIQPPVPPSGLTHTVVGIGDSYASGQGAPNAPISWWALRFRPEWDDDRCNRSRNAATVQAIDLLKSDPAFQGDAFVYESFACSGASIQRGVLAPYRGSEPPKNDPTNFLRPQVEEIRTLVNQGHPIDEAQWASECVLPRLNYELCQVAAANNWRYVGGVAPRFGQHGWCAQDRWINTINHSWKTQGHYRGGVHPNARGYHEIALALESELKAKLLGQTVPPTTCVQPVVGDACTRPCGSSYLP